jgi:hypothetical protein
MAAGPQPVTQRLRYFRGQFLHEKDFNDEQAYHLDQERSHTRLFHTPGVADGLVVSQANLQPPEVTVTSGIAYDGQGRRIVLDNDETIAIKNDANYYLVIKYVEAQTDSSNEGGFEGATRWTEGALVEASTSFSPEEAVVLGQVIWNEQEGGFELDFTHRLVAGVKAYDLNVAGNLTVAGTITGDIASNTIESGDLQDHAVTSVKLAKADGSTGQDTDTGSGVKTEHLQDESVTLEKLAHDVRPIASIANVSNPGGNVDLAQAGTITITPDDANNRITIAETHSAVIGNPHNTTAVQVGALPSTGGVISGNLGIGVSPTFPLDVQGRMRIRQTSASTLTAGLWLSGYYRQEVDTMFLGLQNQNTLGIYSNTGNPGWRFTVSLDRGDLAITGNAFKPGGGAWATSSDVRMKREVGPLNDAIDRLLKLKPITFQWKEPEKQGNLTGPQMGFLADDVEEVFPEWVGVDSQGMKTLSIRGFEALAVEALKHLKQENDQLKAAVAQLQEKLDDLAQQKRRFF